MKISARGKFALSAPAIFLAAALALALPLPASGQVLDLDRIINDQLPHNLSQDSKPYFDLPAPKFKEAVPALKGLKPDSSQDQLPVILAGLAKRIGEVLPRLPNLVSNEEIYHFQSAPGTPGAGGLPNEQPWTREFKYEILTHHYTDGSMAIEEVRTDSKGRPADAASQFSASKGYGFGYQWLFFRAAGQPELRFRYLGEQDKEGKKTFVVAFAQDPAKVANPARFQWGGKVAPFYYEGVLWIDQATFDIVVLRSDLLNPLPNLHLLQMSTQVTFHDEPIHAFNAVLWLPSEVMVSSDQGAGPVEETHHYSDYHVFQAPPKPVASP
jgi:hypothetical protein